VPISPESIVGSPDSSERVRRIFTGLAVALTVGAFVGIVVAADRGRLPDFLRRIYDWPGGDKVGHVVLLAVVTFAVALALRGRRFRIARWHAPLASVLVGIGISLEELSQAWFPGRNLSLADLACSYLGICLGSWSASRILSRANRPVEAKVN
jgi:hypothetical protein